MKKSEKSELSKQIKNMLDGGLTEEVVLSKLIRQGFKKQTIKNYIKSLR